MRNVTFGCCNFIVIHFFYFNPHPTPLVKLLVLVSFKFLSVTLYRITPYKEFIKCISFFRHS